MSETKEWYRSSVDGERGYRVVDDGREMVRLDRPMEEILRPWGGGAQWIADVETRPMSKAMMGKAAYDADKELCRCLGILENQKKTWQDLSDNQRIAWMEKGPDETKHGKKRVELWKAIVSVYEPMTRDS